MQISVCAGAGNNHLGEINSLTYGNPCQFSAMDWIVCVREDLPIQTFQEN